MTGPLSGLTVVEVSSFVAAPLCGMTLGQLGAEVIRIDPIGGASDVQRWPLAADGTSIYWTGLNKGKRSATIDLRSPEGQELVQRLIIEGDGVVVTNAAGLSWLSHEVLTNKRPDVIHVQLLGRGDGSTGVDYTVNAGIGFPLVTGPADHAGPINHVLPAWDVCCGLYAALAVVTAVRSRDESGAGARISLALEDVALATAGNLGLLTEPQVTGTQRQRLGNAIYGQYGQDFTSRDGARFMVVTLTRRHFRDLVDVTGSGTAVAALADALGVDFGSEGDRYRYRDVLSGLFATWFADHTAEEITAALCWHHGAVRAVPHLRGGCGGTEGVRQPTVFPVAPTGSGRLLRPRPAGRVRRHPSRRRSRARPGARHRRRPRAAPGIDDRRHRTPDEGKDNRLLSKPKRKDRP